MLKTASVKCFLLVRFRFVLVHILFLLRNSRHLVYNLGQNCWGGGWIGVCWSADLLWFINQTRPSILSPWIQNPGKNCINCVHCDDHFFIFISFPQFLYDLFHTSLTKYFNYTQSPNSGPPKIDELAIHPNCRIQKSVNISLWIRNPGKNIFKIRRSVRHFTLYSPASLRKLGAFFA